ncbi:MAG: ABC transporter ATP-binding protein [Polyangiaceae bacterium]|nr:ABC transporter ATP-binding protein [Polyangiaceae bacterium]
MIPSPANLTTRPPLLRAAALSVHFPGPSGPVRAVDGITLDVRENETLALVGESGCGKSTLARALVGLQPPTAGTVLFEGHELGPLGSRARDARCRDIQMIFQDPDASLNPRLTLEASIAEPLILHERFNSKQRVRRVCDLMAQVGLAPSMRNRYPHELSGGQRQRVCIARALAVRPRLIVCDEAVSALDVSVQAQILNLLKDLQREFGLTYLFITHDLGVVRYMADRIAVMYLGQIVETGSAGDVLDHSTHPYTESLLAAVPSRDPLGHKKRIRLLGDVPSPAHPPSGCRFHTRCPKAFARCSQEMPQLYPVSSGESRCFLNEAPKDA